MYPRETLNMVKHAYLIMETATLSFYLGAKQQYDLLLVTNYQGLFRILSLGSSPNFVSCFRIVQTAPKLANRHILTNMKFYLAFLRF